MTATLGESLATPAGRRSRGPATEAQKAKTSATLKAKGKGSTEFKRCPICGEMKRRATDFRVNSGQTGSYCKPCSNTKQREWHARNPHVSRRSQFKISLFREHSMTVEEYVELLEAQEGRCAICRAEMDLPVHKAGRLQVDHCHETSAIRGLLCTLCNSGLGFFKDSPERLLAAVAYLSNPPCRTGQKSVPAKGAGR